MAYDIRMAKLVSGETVIGKYDAGAAEFRDPAVLQTVPTQQGVQMMLMPLGYPFDNDFTGKVSMQHVIYEYKNCPEELQTKYMEACSNLSLSSGGLGGLGGMNLKGAKASGLLR
ncbi:MAG: hypothetical protein LBN33_10455 [Desulfovibrio sp.]|jgi:hypothetical protein|nr:hypothetical protein [Desulfovibrio sp.]